jgi:hypothetical protein
MATAATSLLGLALPVTGELSGTWGDTVNVSITALLDTAVAGTTTLSSDSDVTLTTTTLAANQARQAIILWTAGGTVTRTITVPAQSKSYIVINKTSSSQSIKIVGVGPTTGVTIVAGTAAFVVWDGADFVTASVTSTTGILPVANGGTGLSSGTSGGVLAYTATGTLASSAALAASALVIGGGAGAAPSTTTTGTGVVTALGVNTGTAGAFVVNGGALGTPSSGTVTNLTGTASININGTVGATTPTTGAFTTLTTSSTVTLSGGTANGVAYLDGSKVLTTGSALTFDGTSVFAAPRVRLNNANRLDWGDQGEWIVGDNGGAMLFGVDTTEQMRLTSTGLGIGTTSPGVKLDVAGASNGATLQLLKLSNTGTGGNTKAQIGFFAASTEYGQISGGYGGSTPEMNFILPSVSAGLFTWLTSAGSEAMRLTSTGLGIGTSSPGFKLDVRGDIAVGTRSAEANVYFYGSGGDLRVILSTLGTGFVIDSDGGIDFKTNNTQAATITSAGNLGIGTSSPVYQTQIYGSGQTTAALTDSGNKGGSLLLNTPTVAGGDGGALLIGAGGAGAKPFSAIKGLLTDGANNTTGSLAFSLRNVSTDIQLTEQMRLTSTGLGIGTSSPGAKLHVESASAESVRINYNSTKSSRLGTTSAGDLQIYSFDSTGVVYRNILLAIDGPTSAGNVGIGTSTPATKLHVNTGAAGYGITVAASSQTGITYQLGIDSSSNFAIYDTNAAAQRIVLSTAGNLGLGATPSAWNLGKAIEVNNVGNALWGAAASEIDVTQNAYYNSGWIYAASSFATRYEQNTGVHRWYNAPSGTAGNAISFTQAMTLDASGNLLVGTTTVGAKLTVEQTGASANGASIINQTFNYQTLGLQNAATSGDNVFITFGTEAAFTTRGSITYNRTGGLTVYNTTSDYRAKDILGPVADSGALIDSVPVYTGKMKGATQERPMFIAHEVPAYAHTGEKDAVDADGNPVYQQMDASALIPVMWAEIQDLRKRLAAAGI